MTLSPSLFRAVELKSTSPVVLFRTTTGQRDSSYL